MIQPRRRKRRRGSAVGTRIGCAAYVLRAERFSRRSSTTIEATASGVRGRVLPGRSGSRSREPSARACCRRSRGISPPDGHPAQPRSRGCGVVRHRGRTRPRMHVAEQRLRGLGFAIRGSGRRVVAAIAISASAGVALVELASDAASRVAQRVSRRTRGRARPAPAPGLPVRRSPRIDAAPTAYARSTDGWSTWAHRASWSSATAAPWPTSILPRWRRTPSRMSFCSSWSARFARRASSSWASARASSRAASERSGRRRRARPASSSATARSRRRCSWTTSALDLRSTARDGDGRGFDPGAAVVASGAPGPRRPPERSCSNSAPTSRLVVAGLASTSRRRVVGGRVAFRAGPGVGGAVVDRQTPAYRRSGGRRRRRVPSSGRSSASRDRRERRRDRRHADRRLLRHRLRRLRRARARPSRRPRRACRASPRSSAIWRSRSVRRSLRSLRTRSRSARASPRISRARARAASSASRVFVSTACCVEVRSSRAASCASRTTRRACSSALLRRSSGGLAGLREHPCGLLAERGNDVLVGGRLGRSLVQPILEVVHPAASSRSRLRSAMRSSETMRRKARTSDSA